MPLPDPRRLPPARLVQLLNSSHLGEVVTLARLRKHRLAAGMHISNDGETVDCLRYIAWLCARRHLRPGTSAPSENEGAPATGSLAEQLAKRRAELSAVLADGARHRI